jgi:hypothetical protein
MKALTSPGVVQISSTPGRRKFRPLIPPRPPCFLALYRDCTNTDAYLQFADGQIWHYDSPSDEVVVALTTAVTHGASFNFSFRRSLTLPGGYEKFTGSIPGTASLIYQYPPYPGSDPGPCPSGFPWALIWLPPDIFFDGDGTDPVWTETAAGLTSFTSLAGGPLSDSSVYAGDSSVSGTMSYTGGGGPAVATVSGQLFNSVADAGSFVRVLHDGVTLVQADFQTIARNLPLSGPFSIPFPFTISAGSGSILEVQWNNSLGTGGPLGSPASLQLDCALS